MPGSAVLVGVHGEPAAGRLVSSGLDLLMLRAGAAGSAHQAVHIRFAGDPNGLDLARMGQYHPHEGLDGTAAVGWAGSTGGIRAAVGREGPLVAAFEGGLTNQARLQADALEAGALLLEATPAELVLALLAQSDQKTVINRLVDAVSQLEGGFALLILDGVRLVGVRDPWGIRSLSLGRTPEGLALATESCVFAALGGQLIRELAPGEMVILQENRMEAIRPFPRRLRKFCALELVGVASLESMVAEREVYGARVRLGEALARQQSAWGDLVVGIPGQSEAQAQGFSRRTAIPLERVLRVSASKTTDFPKYIVQVVRSCVEGRRAVVVDSELSRGGQLLAIVRALRAAGALEVHVRVASPPVVAGCLYGVEFEENPLARDRLDAGTLAMLLECDSFGALDIAGLRETTGEEGWCEACFTREPPISTPIEPGQIPLFVPRS